MCLLDTRAVEDAADEGSRERVAGTYRAFNFYLGRAQEAFALLPDDPASVDSLGKDNHRITEIHLYLCIYVYLYIRVSVYPYYNKAV